MTSKKLSIILVSHNSSRLVDHAVAYLDCNSNENVEVIVVNNSPKYPLNELTSKYSNLNVINNTGDPFYTAGNNLGLASTQGEYIFVMNPDVRIKCEDILKLIQFAETKPNLGVVTPRLTNVDGSSQTFAYRFYSWRYPIYRRTPLSNTSFGKAEIDLVHMTNDDLSIPKQVDWILGAAMLIKKSTIEKVGILDPNLRHYLSDMDYCRRVHNAGLEVWINPEVSAVHYYGRSSAQGNWLTAPFKPATILHYTDWIRYIHKWKGTKLPQL